MAELITKGGRRRQLPPRIDLTPMVDLGFLLITFFIFTATMSSPKAMPTLLPADSQDSTKVAESGSVTLIPTTAGVVYYNGFNVDASQTLPWSSPDELRVKLITLQQNLLQTEGNDDKLFVMIKPTDHTSFSRVVQLLDEMKICQVKQYTLADLDEQEKNLFGGL